MSDLRVLTIGTFDLFHRGHSLLILRASEFGHLTVGVNSDRFAQEYKGKRPEDHEDARLRRVRESMFVGVACINDGPGDALIRLVRPNLLVVGSDWHDHYLPQIGMTPEELFDDLHCGIVYLPRTPGISTTELRSFIPEASRR